MKVTGNLIINDIYKNPLSNKSFEVTVTCSKNALIYAEGYSKEIKILLKTSKTHKRIAGKNLLKDIKDYICPIAGKQESSMVRKRLIGLQKIHSSISNQNFSFAIK
jgi:hypothetical protein